MTVASAVGKRNSCEDRQCATVDIQIFLATACVMLTSGFILIVSSWCHAFLGFIACLVLLFVSAPMWRTNKMGRAALLAGLTGFLYVIFKVDDTTLRVVLLSWIFAALFLIGTGFGDRNEVPRRQSVFLTLHMTALGVAAFLALYRISNEVWFFLRNIREHLPASCSMMGIWVSGLPVYLFGFLFLILALFGAAARHIARRRMEDRPKGSVRWSVLLVGFLMLVAGFFGGLAVLPMSAPVTALKVSLYQLIALILVSVVISLADRALIHDTRPRVVLSSLILTGSVTVLLLIFWFRLLCPPNSFASPRGLTVSKLNPANSNSVSSHTQVSFALYSKGLLDWNTPDFERLGLLNSGMFGLFRRSLERYAAKHGGRAVVIDQITDQSLSNIAVVIFINPTKALTPNETLCLKRFVTSGAAMLVLGDHTGIGGSTEPLKTILSFSSIRFNFDSAVPLRQHWPGCLELRPHPIARDLKDELTLQIAVGASLSVEKPAVPIVVARYGFADRGDSLNAGRGAYMGDTEHERGEPVGDLVLVAGERIGDGRIIVFGDTSPFQNGALFLSQRFVGNVMAWLIAGDQLRDRVEGEDSGSASHGEESDKALGDGAAGVPPERISDEMRFGDETALVDFSLKPGASLSLFSPSSLGGLANCLARVGVVASPVFLARDWGKESPYLFLVAPTLRLGQRELRWLTDYMSQGGNVILSEKYASPQPSGPLLSWLGFSIRNIPLGNGDSHSCVNHKDGWALSYGGEADTTVIARAFGYPTVVQMPFGRGSFTLISDGRFLLDENLESEREANRRNIVFVAQLIEDLRQKGHH